MPGNCSCGHLTLVISFLSFLIWHMWHANQQERFIFPMLPVFLLMAVLALWDRLQVKGYFLRNARTFRILCGVSVALNLVLLIPLILSYGHKGLIESVITVRKLQPDARVLYLQPGMRHWIPIAYADSRSRGTYVKEWSELPMPPDTGFAKHTFDYAVLFPTETVPLAVCLDTLSARRDSATLVAHIAPSFLDALLHRMNPRHNDAYEAYVYHLEVR